MDFLEPAAIMAQEDEATLAAIDRGIKAADEGRVFWFVWHRLHPTGSSPQT